MKVTFQGFGEHLASSRLRAYSIQPFFDKGNDVLVIGKHGWPIEIIEQFGMFVYDVCDWRDENIPYCHAADLITCNSEVMAAVIYSATGLDAHVIPDPYEGDEREAKVGESLLWFGHQTNLKDLEPYSDLPIKILTGNEWSIEAQKKALDECGMVIIPTGQRKTKSANRVLEAIRAGRMPVVGHMPSYSEFSEYIPIGDIREGIERVLANPSKSVEQIKEAQDYIRDKYSPATIARKWKRVING